MYTMDINNIPQPAKTAVLPHTNDQIAPFRKPICYECPLTFLLGYRHVIPQRLVAFTSCAKTELVNVMKVAALHASEKLSILHSPQKHSCCLSQLCGDEWPLQHKMRPTNETLKKAFFIYIQ